MSDLPSNWSEVPIGSFARVVGGGTPPSKDPANFAMPGQGIPWVTPADLSGYKCQTVERGARDLTDAGFAACGATLLPEGSVLFSSRAPIGYVAIAANPISTNQGFKSFVLPEGFDPRFTYYQLKHLKPEAEGIATGTTFKELSGAAAATLPFRVAPVAEQTRIANQLDTLLARVNACNDHLDAIPGILKRFRQAVLTCALTSDVREQVDDSAAEAPVKTAKISDIASVGTGSTPLRSNSAFYASTGTPWVTSAATGSPFVVGADQFVTEAAIATHRLKVYPKGTLLVAMYGEGKTRGQVSELAIEATINQACAAISVNEELAARQFVKLALTANYLVMRELAEGGNQPNLNLSKIKDFEIPLPPLDEQARIVGSVEKLLTFADRVEARYTAMRAHVQRLAPQVLAKAFRGELVEQDPNDEPASALLARLVSQRTASSPNKKPRRPSKPRTTRAPAEASSMTKSRQDEDVKGLPYLAGHLRRLGVPTTAQSLFKEAELPVADFYKQLAWEIAEGHVKDNQTTLEPGHATG
ncbi:MAG TPA: restriction endonuclease subunit S [Limnobacter sp.]|uniref:restriction endonuclease subunit S n=1 Tax=Limnobacter sp. TaxID=2003368 RepID=UPI002EDBA67B